MKILKLKITGYKNLNVSLNFTNSTNYITFIGLNGSGKSNILEAVSLIFANLYNSRAHPLTFTYDITYQIKNYEIHIRDKVMSLVKENGIAKNQTVTRNKYDYLPSEIIACYSGDELRLWREIYSKLYFSYLRKVKDGITHEKHKLIYINKYAWEIALITLLCHDNSLEYIKNLLKIDDLTGVDVKFSFPANYDVRRQQYVRFTEGGTEAQNDALGLIDIIKRSQGNSNIAINDIKDIIFIENQDNTKKARKLFHLLYAIGSDKDNKLFEKISITFNSITLKELSEGEKKVILVKCITDILANENSLILLDEPDSHIHIAKKKEIVSIIDKQNYFSLLTSHSPSLCQSIPSNNIVLLQEGNYLPIADSIEAAKKIIDNDAVLKLLFSTKDILLVEGKTDEKYISKAIELFRTDYPNLNLDFIRLGGTDEENIESVIDKIANNSLRKIIIMTDRDDAGMKIYKRMFPLSRKEKQNVCIEEHTPDKNIYFVMIPHKDTANQGGDFLIEDYFSKQSMRDLTKQYIDNHFGDDRPFKQFPKVKEKLKTELLPNHCENCNPADMVDFKLLLDKLQEIVDKPNN